MERILCLVMIFILGSGKVLTAGFKDSQHAINVEELTGNIKKIVESRGYPFEQHTVTTEDNYILSLHRIKHGKGGREANRTPLLLQHGVLGSSARFMAYPKSMAYYLADAGYDVWMGNARGNTFSRQHSEKDPDTDRSFWDFSFHEMGLKDLPINLQHIKKETGNSKVHYVGLSMGTTQFLVMASMLPDQTLEMVDRIILMAPVARTKYMGILANPIKFLLNKLFLTTVQKYGHEELFRYQETPAELARRLCSSVSFWIKFLCEFVVRKIVAANKELHDFKRDAKDTARLMDTSAGTSVKTYLHYMQISKAGEFQQYDYQGENKAHYKGQTTPPKYHLSKINKRVHLICGGADKISAKKDVDWLIAQLPDVVPHTDGFQSFAHDDFLYGSNLERTLYKKLVEILSNTDEKH